MSYDQSEVHFVGPASHSSFILYHFLLPFLVFIQVYLWFFSFNNLTLILSLIPSAINNCIFGSTYLAIHPEQVPSTQSLHHDAPTTMLQSRGWCFQGTGFLPNVALCPKVKAVQILSLLHGISSVFLKFLLINLLQSPIRAPSELLI